VPADSYPPPPAGYVPPPAGYPQPYAQPYPGYAGGSYAQPPPPAPGTNGFAIASLVLGIIGGVLLSVIFGIVALAQIRKRPQGGRGLAIAGLSLSGAWLLVILVLCGIGAITDSLEKDDPAPSPTAAGPYRVSVWDLREGDCVGDLGGRGTVADLPLVKCTEPHDGEVFATFTLPAGAWPGDEKVDRLSDEGCSDRLEGYARGPVDDLEYIPLTPLQEEWPEDRGVTCIATDPTGTRTKSLRD
jgi:hypothetical protein